ncbi:MAG: 30S ribosomal protein S4e [Candidatus Woesearchaeota archaeon]|jgi:small subunit ribosomal protein S4e
MVRNHLKVITAPRTWPVPRKNKVWITRPNSGAHKLSLSLSLNSVLKDILSFANTRKEVNYILGKQEVLVDGSKRTDKKFGIGIMDTLALPLVKKYYRVMFDKFGKLSFVEITEHESKMKPAKIVNKTCVKGGIVLNLDDGRNIPVAKDTYKTGNSVIIELPSQKIVKQLPLQKGAYVYLIGGKHLGESGKVEELNGIHIIFKTHSKLIKTLTKYALVIGEEKPEIKLSE